jgi:hypothetical protein
LKLSLEVNAKEQNFEKQGQVSGTVFSFQFSVKATSSSSEN